MRTQKLMFRWSLVTGGLIALFWAIYSLSTGSVPIVTSVKMTSTWTMSLPFGISRWWDILIGPIWSIIIISFLTKLKDKDKDDILGGGYPFICKPCLYSISSFLTKLKDKDDILVTGLLLGLAFCLVLGLAFCLVLGLAFCLVAIISSKSFWSKIGNWLMAKE